jgi:uncharacterized repeat protein (TIGR01451 family)
VLNTGACSPPVPGTLSVSGAGSSFSCVLTGSWAAGQQVNEATASGSYSDGGGNTASPSVKDKAYYFGSTPSLSITKSGTLENDVVAPNGRSDVGDKILYGFTVTNTGNVALSSVTVTDPLTSTNCVIGSLAPGASDSTTCSAGYTLTQSDIDAGSVTNTAGVSGSVTDSAGNSSTPFATSTKTVSVPQVVTVDLAKSGVLDESVVSPGTRADAGDRVDYSFTVENTGNVTLHGVSLSDAHCDSAPSLVSGDTNSDGKLDVGETWQYSCSYTVGQAEIDAGSVTNNASVDALGPLDDSSTPADDATDSAAATVAIPQVRTVSIVKSGTLHTDVVAPNDRVDAGDTVGYSFTVTNTGNVTLTGVKVTDPLTSLNCSVGTLAPGQSDSTTCSASYTLTQPDVDAGEVDNTATADAKAPQGEDVTASSSATVSLPAAPSLDLVKTASLDDTVVAPSGRADAGDKVAYSFTVTNTGNVTLTGVKVTDPLTGLNCLVGTLAPGASDSSTCTASYTLTQPDVDAGSLSNTATATGTPPHGSDVSATDTATVTLPAAPSLDLVKYASLDEAAVAPADRADAGDKTHYSFTVTNTGNVTLTGVTVTDPLTSLNCLVGTLAPGASDSHCAATYTLMQADVDAGSRSNTATATGTPPQGADTSDDDSATATLPPAPSVNLVKSATLDQTVVAPTDRVDAGDKTHYTFVVTNTGNVTLTGVKVTDPLTSLDCSVGTLAPGQSDSSTCTAAYTLTQSDIDLGFVSSTATATGTPPHGDDVSADDTATVTLPAAPSLQLTKETSTATYTHPGDELDYSYTLKNTGNVTLGGPFTIQDDRSSDAACPATPGSIAPGTSVTCTGAYNATQADIDAGFVTNTATADAQFNDATITSNADHATVTATQQPSVSLAKTADESTYADVGPVLPYTYALSNSGNVTLATPSVTDNNVDATPHYASGDSNNNGQLDVGETWTFKATHTVTQSELDSGSVTNTATGHASFNASPVDSAAQTVTVYAAQNASLTLVKVVDKGFYDAVGQVLNYTYSLTNSGNVTLDTPSVDDDNVDVGHDPLYSAGDTNHNGKLDVGETWTFTAQHTVNTVDIFLGSITNNATGHAAFAFYNSGSDTTINSNTETRTVDNHAADVSIAKSASPDPVLVGENLTYTLTVTNNGPYTASTVSVQDPVPSGTTYVSSSPGCDDTVTCAVGDLAPHATATITIVVTPAAAGTVTNTATVSAEEGDPVPGNNTAKVTTTVNPRPTTLAYTGATTSHFHDVADVSARLTDTNTTSPIASRTVTFTLNGAETCSGTTDTSGIAACQITPNEFAGPYTLSVAFAGDSTYKRSSTATAFSVTKEETTTTYTGPSGAILNGSTVMLSGVLKEDGTIGIGSRTLVLALGTQSCTAVTNASGTASCSIVVSQPLGPGTVSATFAGDGYYQPSADSKTALVYASASAGNGAFAVGDKTATGNVIFWGSQWSTANSLSGGSAPAAFKGFAKLPGTPSCGGTWATDPGNSAPPPAGPLPAYIAVIVTSASTKSGSQISGNIFHIVIVKTNAGYDANPGYPATGTVVATIC